jgi:hypothetical protein
MEKSYDEAVRAMQESPVTLTIFTQPMCFVSQNGLQRCVSKDTEYFPPNYVSKILNGYGNLVQNVIRSARRYGADLKANLADLKKATGSSDDFWFLYEAPLMESEAGAMMAYTETSTVVANRLKENALIGQICYGISLALTFIVFLFVFGSLRRSVQAETRYNRGVLYMIPHDVLRNTKAMIEYIETLHGSLF